VQRADAFDRGYDAQHAVVFPGIAIILSALSLQMVGDGFRDLLDLHEMFAAFGTEEAFWLALVARAREQGEIDSDPESEREEIRKLKRENSELRRANEIASRPKNRNRYTARAASDPSTIAMITRAPPGPAGEPPGAGSGSGRIELHRRSSAPNVRTPSSRSPSRRNSLRPGYSADPSLGS